MDALTHPTYRDALRVAALAKDDGVTAMELAEELHATRAWALTVLNELEAQGFVKGLPAKDKRRAGVATRYRFQAHKVEAAIADLRAWILGEPTGRVSRRRKTSEPPAEGNES